MAGVCRDVLALPHSSSGPYALVTPPLAPPPSLHHGSAWLNAVSPPSVRAPATPFLLRPGCPIAMCCLSISHQPGLELFMPHHPLCQCDLNAHAACAKHGSHAVPISMPCSRSRPRCRPADSDRSRRCLSEQKGTSIFTLELVKFYLPSMSMK